MSNADYVKISNPNYFKNQVVSGVQSRKNYWIDFNEVFHKMVYIPGSDIQ